MELVGRLASDLRRARLRRASGGRQRLRDALRHLMAWSYEHRRPFSIDELPRIFEQATGVDVGPILERWLRAQDPQS